MFSLVIPTYNPGPSIEPTWQAVRRFVLSRDDDWEVLFVCDGCTDGSDQRLQELSRDWPIPLAQVLSYPHNRGKGYAVRLGLSQAQGQWRLFTDFDLAYSFEDIEKLGQQLQLGSEVVIANRQHAASRMQLPPRRLGYAFRRQLQSAVFNWMARHLLAISQADTQAGLKGLTAQVAELILPRMQCNGFGFDCELLIACARYNIPVQEVPVCVRYEDAVSSTGGLRTMWRMIRELWSIRRTWAEVPEFERRSVSFGQALDSSANGFSPASFNLGIRS